GRGRPRRLHRPQRLRRSRGRRDQHVLRPDDRQTVRLGRDARGGGRGHGPRAGGHPSGGSGPQRALPGGGDGPGAVPLRPAVDQLYQGR
ncbi:hypothetical protein LTR94_036078, partial [Friedmanniomyces endolithicus]